MLEPLRLAPPRPAPPRREPPSTPARLRPPNLTRAEPAASPPGAKAAPALAAGRPSLSWGSRRAPGRDPARLAAGPRREPAEAEPRGPRSRSDSRSRGLPPPASRLIAPWLAAGSWDLAWLAPGWL